MEKTLFFDGIEYSADDMITYLGIITTDGVVKGKAGGLAVSVSGSTVTVASGYAFLSGRLYTSDTSVTLTLASATTARTDAVVLKLDLPTKSLTPVIKQNASTAGSGELLLATIAVSSSGATVTDKRSYAALSLDYSSTRIDRDIVDVPAGSHDVGDTLYTYSIPYAGFTVIKVRVVYNFSENGSCPFGDAEIYPDGSCSAYAVPLSSRELNPRYTGNGEMRFSTSVANPDDFAIKFEKIQNTIVITVVEVPYDSIPALRFEFDCVK